MNGNPFIGTWTYRSLLNEPDVTTDFDKLEFGRGTLVITEASSDTLGGTIGGPGWSLSLHGSFGYGSPMQVRFQGRGLVGGEEWIYDYIWLVGAGLAQQQRATPARRYGGLGGAYRAAFKQRWDGPGRGGGVFLRGARR